MAIRELMMISAVLLLALVEFSTCALLLSGSVTCLDCHRPSNLSDIKVVVKCYKVKKLAVATTSEDGTFKTELPSDTPAIAVVHPPSSNCVARILGGPTQLYSSRKSMVSQIVMAPESGFYTLSAPLKFQTTCPLSNGDCGSSYTANAEIGSSKTIPLYYIPFLPIIGVP